MAAGGRVSIPAGVRRTIADIKEIAGGHGDEEVYAMLRECNMDPNETAQKLLLQDTFHEVKSKRDKKKEGNKEPSDSRWRPVMQGRGGKGVRVNNSSRHLAITTDPGGRIAISGKENEVKKNLCAVGDMPRSDSISLVDPRADPPPEEGATAVGSNVPQSLKPPASVLGSCASVSDPVLVLSSKSHSLGDVGVAKQAIGTHWTAREHNAVCCELPMDNKGTSLSSASLSFGRSSGSRPSSSYSNRSQQSSSSQKVLNKEWKPKSTSITAAQATEVVIVPDDVPLIAETVAQSAAPISNSVSKEDLLKVDKKFNDLLLPDRQHVIIPEHLQVSESEKYGLTFGSFSTGFHQTMGSSTPECADSSSPPEYGLSQKLNDIDDEFMPRDQNSSSTVPEAADPDPQLLLAEKLETSSPLEVENPSSPHEVAGSNQCRDASATSGIPQSSSVQTTPPYSAFELSPQIHGNQISSLETSQSQGHNSSLLSSSGSAPLAIPAAGVVPTSIAISQQSVPVFRQPVGVHLPYYPQNYIPYNQYISPYFIPPPTIYPFLGNTAFTQPPSTGPMYPAPGSAAVVPPVKYSAPSFKPANNTGSQLSQASVGIPGAYGTYGSNPSVYTDNMAVSNGNPAENDDATSSQFKENSIYIAGQQSEGSTMWIPAPGRDMPGLQASSFYGLPPQGQHIKFAPGQAPHSPFGGIYHPSQTMGGGTMHPLFQPSQTMAGAVELTGPPGSIYQQQQTQMNWGHYC